GVRRENSRYLTGFVLADGEEKVGGHSGQFLLGRDEVIVLAGSRCEIHARQEAPGTRIADAGYDLPGAWLGLVESLGAKRVAVEAGFVPFAVWRRLGAAAAGLGVRPRAGGVDT